MFSSLRHIISLIISIHTDCSSTNDVLALLAESPTEGVVKEDNGVAALLQHRGE